MFDKILVPLDGSSYSRQALDVAIDLAKRYQGALLLLHVIRNLSLPQEILQMLQAGEVTEGRMELLQNSAEIILENGREQCARAGFSNITTAYLFGDPAGTIADFAREKGVTLIVIGHRGLEEHEPYLLGGVARKLTNISEISCLVIK